MSIQSEFHKDVSNYEPPIRFGMTQRQLVMVVQCVPGIILIALGAFKIHVFNLFLIYAVIVMIVLLAPPIMKGTGMWEKWLVNFYFNVKAQNRYLSNGQIRRYDASEFIQKQEVKETDRFGD